MIRSIKSRLRTGISLSAIVGLGLTLSGCAAINGYPNDPETDSLSTNQDGGCRANATILVDLRAKYFGNGFTSLKAKYDAAATGDRKNQRDDIVYGQMKVLDIEFACLKRSLNGDSNALSIGTDVTSQTLSTLSAVVGGAHVKSILGAASTGISAMNGDVNKDLFYQKTIPAVIAQMDANYTKEQALILTHLKSDDGSYPLGAAETEIDTLKDAGSVPAAISALTQDSDASKAQADNDKAVAAALPTTVTFMHDSAGDALVKWLFPNGDNVADAGRLGELQDWMNSPDNKPLNSYPPALLVRGDDPSFAKYRLAAAAHFGLKVASDTPAAQPDGKKKKTKHNH
jgi:hypothetical protein